MARRYINSRDGYSEFTPPSSCGEKCTTYTGHYGLAIASNGFLTKFYKDVPFMKNIMNQVNRVWNYNNQNNPDICIDEVGLIPLAHMGVNSSIVPTLYETSNTSICTTNSQRQKYAYRSDIDPTYLNGWFSQSAANQDYIRVAFIRFDGTPGYTNNGTQCYGISPRVLIG